MCIHEFPISQGIFTTSWFLLIVCGVSVCVCLFCISIEWVKRLWRFQSKEANVQGCIPFG